MSILGTQDPPYCAVKPKLLAHEPVSTNPESLRLLLAWGHAGLVRSAGHGDDVLQGREVNRLGNVGEEPETVIAALFLLACAATANVKSADLLARLDFPLVILRTN